MSQGERVEIRQWVDRELINVIDAVALAKGVDRSDVITAVLRTYAQGKLHEATLIQRLTQGNGTSSVTAEKPPEWAQTIQTDGPQ